MGKLYAENYKVNWALVIGNYLSINDQWIFVRRPDFEDLEVYQLAEKLVNEIWRIVK